MWRHHFVAHSSHAFRSGPAFEFAFGFGERRADDAGREMLEDFAIDAFGGTERIWFEMFVEQRQQHIDAGVNQAVCFV